MRAKLKIIVPSSIKHNIRREINRVIDVDFKQEVGEEIVEDIKINARRGRGVVNGLSVKLPPLASSTIKHREYLKRAGNATAKPYSNRFSNLSMSGQLIDSIGYIIGSGGEIIIQAIKNLRVPYRTLSGRRQNTRPITNNELLLIHQHGNTAHNLPARPILGIRNELFKRIIIKLRYRLRDGLKLK
jgi:hypothetical protein